LLSELNKISNMPRNSYTRKEMQRLNIQISDSNIRLKVLRTALNKSEAMKKTYENSFAEAQIKAAKMSSYANGNIGGDYKFSSVFEDYDIFREVMDSDGVMRRHRVDPNSARGKEIRMKHEEFIKDYQLRMYRIRRILRIHRKKDDNFTQEIERIYKGKNLKMGDSLTNIKNLMGIMDRKIDELGKENVRYRSSGTGTGAGSFGGSALTEIKNSNLNLRTELKGESLKDRAEFRSKLQEERARLNKMKDTLLSYMERENIKFEEKLRTIEMDVINAGMTDVNQPKSDPANPNKKLVNRQNLKKSRNPIKVDDM